MTVHPLHTIYYRSCCMTLHPPLYIHQVLRLSELSWLDDSNSGHEDYLMGLMDFLYSHTCTHTHTHIHTHTYKHKHKHKQE
jgi:hypothetical protein